MLSPKEDSVSPYQRHREHRGGAERMKVSDRAVKCCAQDTTGQQCTCELSAAVGSCTKAGSADWAQGATPAPKELERERERYKEESSEGSRRGKLGCR